MLDFMCALNHEEVFSTFYHLYIFFARNMVQTFT
jgi:hypothetical protein